MVYRCLHQFFHTIIIDVRVADSFSFIILACFLFATVIRVRGWKLIRKNRGEGGGNFFFTRFWLHPLSILIFLATFIHAKTHNLTRFQKLKKSILKIWFSKLVKIYGIFKVPPGTINTENILSSKFKLQNKKFYPLWSVLII